MAAPNTRHYLLHFFPSGNAVTLAGAGANAAAGRGLLVLNPAALFGHGDAASAATDLLKLAADLRGHGDNAAASTSLLLLTARVAGHGDNATAGAAGLLAALALAGHGDAAAASISLLQSALDLAGHGDAASAGPAGLKLAAALTGHGDASSAGTAGLNLAVALAGHGDNAASGTLVSVVVPPTPAVDHGGGAIPTLRYPGRRPHLVRPKQEPKPERPVEVFESDIERNLKVWVTHASTITYQTSSRARLSRDTAQRTITTPESEAWIEQRNVDDESILVAYAARLIEV